MDPTFLREHLKESQKQGLLPIAIFATAGTTDFGSIDPLNTRMDEDCLYLNVWTPATSAAEKLAVMVWIHGGSNLNGAGSQPEYDGARLAGKGVVVVTINYRLDIFGFLATPELTKESDTHASGNYGLLDQVAALKWVQTNISVFGGDPTRVTVFGESAGSLDISALMTSPLTRGLINGVAMQSSVPSGCEIQTLDDARDRTGAKVVAATGCDRQADIAACLRPELEKRSHRFDQATGVAELHGSFRFRDGEVSVRIQQ